MFKNIHIRLLCKILTQSFRLGSLAIFSTSLCVLSGALQPASLFQDGMVLQRDQPVQIWGKDAPGTLVKVQLGEIKAETLTAGDGRWQLQLAPMEASFEPAEMRIQGSAEIILQDILIGEVWIASGQSNMSWTLQQSEDPEFEIKGNDFPAIREFQVVRAVAETPQDGLTGQWRAASAENIATFGAVAHYFARDLQAVEKVPVGIILTAWGGTRIEAWMSPESLQETAFSHTLENWQQVLAQHPERHARYIELRDAWQAERDAARQANRPFNKPAPRAPQGPGHSQSPSGLYNAMLHPLSPYTIRGFLWYQGESNVAAANEYHARFSRMIEDWRLLWQEDTLPFYWVQLSTWRANAPHSSRWPFLREAQTQTLALPHTGQALSYDIGDAHDIHPQNKRTVGRRLARIALNQIHGRDFQWQGPQAISIERENEGYRIHFANAEGGLRTTDATLQGFQIAGADRVFHDASASIEGATVRVQSPLVSEPVAVRFAWTNPIPAKLYNQKFLPALPFRNDDWAE